MPSECELGLPTNVTCSEESVTRNIEVVMKLPVSDNIRTVPSGLHDLKCGFHMIDKFAFAISINDDIVSSCAKLWSPKTHFLSSFLCFAETGFK
jgi:hypothetical protein